MKLKPPSRSNVQVGVAHDCIDYVLPFAYSFRYQRVTGITVSLTVGPTELTLAALEQARLAFVLTDRDAGTNPDIEQETVYENPVFVVSAPDHPLAAARELVLSDLVGERWIVSSCTTKLELCGIFQRGGLPRPDVALHAGSSSLHRTIVATARFLGVHGLPTVLALAEARSRLAVLPVRDLAWNRPIFAVHRRHSPLSPAARKLIDDLKALAIRPENLRAS